jgi:hypothetical protein
MLVAMVGTSLSLGILAALFHALPPDAAHFLAGSGGIRFLPTWAIAYLIVGGGMLGLLGSLVSVSKFLK